jgi:hypothetical protein
LRAEEGGRGPHLARGGDEVARVSAEEAEIVGAAEEAGRGTERSVLAGWAGCLCLRNAVLGQDWKVVGWTVEFVRGGRMDDGRVVLITCQPRLGRLLASQTTPSCYFLFLFLFLTFFIAAFSSQY